MVNLYRDPVLRKGFVYRPLFKGDQTGFFSVCFVSLFFFLFSILSL